MCSHDQGRQAGEGILLRRKRQTGSHLRVYLLPTLNCGLTIAPDVTDTAKATFASSGSKSLIHSLDKPLLTMLGVGGTLGVGFFLRISLALHLAGSRLPLTFLMAASVAACLGIAIGELGRAHYSDDWFETCSESYLHEWVGFVVRYTYWASLVFGMCSTVAAVTIYASWWVPNVPSWLLITVLFGAVVFVNLWRVHDFARFVFWASSLKVLAIFLFVVGGVFYLSHHSSLVIGQSHLPRDATALLPYGIPGTWKAIVFVIGSFAGVEVIGVAAGEVRDAQRNIAPAFWAMLTILSVAYLAGTFVLIGVLPAARVVSTENTPFASPFVLACFDMGYTWAGHAMNGIVIVAALTALNSTLYSASRTLFTTARSGWSFSILGGLSKRRVPVIALLTSATGFLIAMAVNAVFGKQAFVYFGGVTMFGAMVVWISIFASHISYRAWHVLRQPGSGARSRIPITSIFGLAFVLALLLTTIWVQPLRLTLPLGLAWIFALSIFYWWVRLKRSRVGADERAFAQYQSVAVQPQRSASR